MDFAISWVAIADIELSAAAKLLSLTIGDETDEVPDFEISGTTTKNGWALFLFNEIDTDRLSDAWLTKISTDRNVVIVHVEEHAMWQHAELRRDGQTIWMIDHDSSKGPRHLEAIGALPESFAEIHRARLVEQDSGNRDGDDVDYISEVPLDVAAELVGFCHDETEDEFVEMLLTN